MNNEELIKNLYKLIQLDIDATHAYEQALKNIDKSDIHQTIRQFRDDHERHINELSAIIRTLGGKPPEKTPDLKGYLIEGFTSLRSITGTEGALKAMRSNEKMTNRWYEDAVQWNVSVDIKTLLQKNYADEQRHLQYIEHAIETKLWEK